MISPLRIVNSTYSGNVLRSSSIDVASSGAGGAIYVDSNNHVSIESSKIMNSHGAVSGGGIGW